MRKKQCNVKDKMYWVNIEVLRKCYKPFIWNSSREIQLSHSQKDGQTDISNYRVASLLIKIQNIFGGTLIDILRGGYMSWNWNHDIKIIQSQSISIGL